MPIQYHALNAFAPKNRHMHSPLPPSPIREWERYHQTGFYIGTHP